MCCQIIVLCFNCSCSHGFEYDVVLLDCNDSVKANATGIHVDTFFYVKLESSDTSVPLGFIQRVEFLDSLILIQDENGAYAFDSCGKYLFRIGDKGHGPGEYINVSGMWVSKHNHLIYVGDSFAGKILSYDTSGKYKGALIPPDNSLYLIHQADYIFPNQLFVSRYMYKHHNSAYSVIDLDEMSVDSIDSYKIHSDLMADRLGIHPYSIRDNSALYVLPFDNNIYEYSGGRTRALYRLNANKHLLTEKERSEINDLFISAMSENYYEGNFIGFTDIFETSSCVFLNSLYDYFLINKRSNKVTCCNYFIGDPISQLPLLRISGIKDDYLISVLTPYDASRLQFSDQLDDDAKLLYGVSEQMNDDDNPVLLFYKISCL